MSNMNIAAEIDTLLSVGERRFLGHRADLERMLLALFCRQHCLLVGPPGVAKSAMATFLAERSGMTFFRCVFHAEMLLEELMGPISIKALETEDVLVRRTDGFLPTAQVAFLDEVFRASGPVRDAMLSVLNERGFRNGQRWEPAALVTAYAASNRWPNDREIIREEAFLDRFLIKREVGIVPGKLRAIAFQKQDEIIEPEHAGLGPEVYERVRNAAARMRWSRSAKSAFGQIVSEVREQGVYVSDRRLQWAVQAVNVWAVMRSSKKVELSDLGILDDILWTYPKDREAVCETARKFRNEQNGELVKELIELCQSVEAKGGRMALVNILDTLATGAVTFRRLMEQIEAEDVRAAIKDRWASTAEILVNELCGSCEARIVDDSEV